MNQNQVNWKHQLHYIIEHELKTIETLLSYSNKDINMLKLNKTRSLHYIDIAIETLQKLKEYINSL